MEEVTVFGDHQILEMSVTDGHNVGDGSISSTWDAVVFIDMVQVQIVFICSELEVGRNVTFVIELHLLDRRGVVDELHQTVVWTASYAFVGSESKVEVDFLQEHIYNGNDLQYKLILTQIITILYYKFDLFIYTLRVRKGLVHQSFILLHIFLVVSINHAHFLFKIHIFFFFFDLYRRLFIGNLFFRTAFLIFFFIVKLILRSVNVLFYFRIEAE